MLDLPCHVLICFLKHKNSCLIQDARAAGRAQDPRLSSSKRPSGRPEGRRQSSRHFLVKCIFTAVRVNILKTCLGTYRSLFLIGNSSSRRKFSIKDRVYVAISQNHSKSGKFFQFKTQKSGSLKNVDILVDFLFLFLESHFFKHKTVFFKNPDFRVLNRTFFSDFE